MRLLKLLFVVFFMLSIHACDKNAVAAADQQNYTEGKDYYPVEVTGPNNLNNVNVAEFFNYGCPACNLAEPSVQKWLKAKPASVSFERIPVLFHPDWMNYTKAFYVAKALGVESKITPAIFKAIHTDKQDLNSEQALAKFFATQGVSEAEFTGIFNFTPGMVGQINHGNELMQAYLISPTLIAKYNWVPEIPTFIINGKYLVSLGTANGDSERMMHIVDYLLKK